MSGQLKEVRERITSVQSTQQITKAMKLVSAAKLRRAQQSIVQMRPYAMRLHSMFRNILESLGNDADTSFNRVTAHQQPLLVIVTSSRGLCGAFNSNIIKEARRLIDSKFKLARKNSNLTLLCIGKKGYEYFARHYSDCTMIDDHVDLFSSLNFDAASEVADHIINSFQEEVYDSITVVYARFKNAVVQLFEADQYLPVSKPDFHGDKKMRADYIFEPDQEELLDHLMPTILKTHFFRYMLDTHASEHGARMTAMDAATDNAEELIKELRINYNKARQAAITKEISEIVGGAAALEG
jgi:F-type H+-transporting ATPase subunit gamma